MGAQVWSLVSLGVGLNLVLGSLVAAFKLPLYLDSLGTVLVAALAGPGPGALTGGCGVALLGLTNPIALAFLPVGMTVGMAAGWTARRGAFRRLSLAGVAGALTGCLTALLSAPIAAVMFGGVTGGGTDLVVALFRAGGLSTLQAALGQSLAVDPLDKTVTFGLVFVLLQALPHRTAAAFPQAESLPRRGHRLPPYRPRQDGSRTPLRAAPPPAETISSTRRGYPQAPTEWKLVALLSVLLWAGLTAEARPLSLALVALWGAYALAAPRLTWETSRRLLPLLLPLAVSLVVIHGLIASSPGEPRALWMGLSWSPSGLEAAWLFLTRLALILLSLSMFLATTPLQRLAELLCRWRVPYPLVFVLLTGANLGSRLGQRWRVVEQAQQARGLSLRPGGWLARGRVLLGLLTPTLGAVFSEIPLRSASLESRGLLHARPRHAIPLAWTGEPPPTPGGRLFYLALCLATWGSLLWR